MTMELNEGHFRRSRPKPADVANADRDLPTSLLYNLSPLEDLEAETDLARSLGGRRTYHKLLGRFLLAALLLSIAILLLLLALRSNVPPLIIVSAVFAGIFVDYLINALRLLLRYSRRQRVIHAYVNSLADVALTEGSYQPDDKLAGKYPDEMEEAIKREIYSAIDLKPRR